MPNITLTVSGGKIRVSPDSLQVVAGNQATFIGGTQGITFKVVIHNYEPFFAAPAQSIIDKDISYQGAETFTVAPLVNSVKYYSICVVGQESAIKPPDAPPRIIITPLV
jgi:hypothetical protein